MNISQKMEGKVLTRRTSVPFYPMLTSALLCPATWKQDNGRGGSGGSGASFHGEGRKPRRSVCCCSGAEGHEGPRAAGNVGCLLTQPLGLAAFHGPHQTYLLRSSSSGSIHCCHWIVLGSPSFGSWYSRFQVNNINRCYVFIVLELHLASWNYMFLVIVFFTSVDAGVVK